MQNPKKLGEHAVVVGGSIGGMAAARALAEHFHRVTVVERDRFEPGRRRSVPQANHFHVLLRRGVELLEAAFPGLTGEMEAAGIKPLDFARDLCWLQYGGWLPRGPSDVIVYPQTRAFLESRIRSRLRRFDNVELRESVTARGLLTTPDRKRVVGVRLCSTRSPAAVTELTADFVVDASGRGTKVFKWLAELGYAPPEETRLPIDLCYASRVYEPTGHARDWQGLWVSPLPPSVPRGGALQHIEDNRWIVSMFGYHGHHPARDETGFLEFAKTLLHPCFYETIKDAKPLSEIHIFRVAEERWRHLERVKEFPGGLLVVGDAYCYFDPVFGQGMCIALIEADFLKKYLGKLSSADGLTGAWAVSYFRACSGWIRGIWYFVSAEAMRHPQCHGKRSWLVRFLQWYVMELYALNRKDPVAYRAFLRLMHLQSGPTVVLRPKNLLRLAWRGLARLRGKRVGVLPRAGELPPAPAAPACDAEPIAPKALTRVVFGMRYAKRVLANLLLPGSLGARDRLCHYDKRPPWQPKQGLEQFIRDAMHVQELQAEADEIRYFLDFWLPVQILKVVNRTLIEFSTTAQEPGLGFLLYGDNRTMNRAFRAYCRRIGIYSPAAELCCAICDTFRPSDLGLVRAEFKPGGPTRYSIAASWQLDLRRRAGFAEKMDRLPEPLRSGAFAERVRAFEAALAPDYYPLFFGLSFLRSGTLEAKMYLARFDGDRSPLYPGSILWRFIESMGLPDGEMVRLKELNQLLWSNSSDKMTQIAVEVAASQSAPKRVNLIYCGTKLTAIKEAACAFGYVETLVPAVEKFEGMMQSEQVKFLGVRVTPNGISPRFKLYGHALFDLNHAAEI